MAALQVEALVEFGVSVCGNAEVLLTRVIEREVSSVVWIHREFAIAAQILESTITRLVEVSGFENEHLVALMGNETQP